MTGKDAGEPERQGLDPNSGEDLMIESPKQSVRSSCGYSCGYSSQRRESNA